MLQPFFKKTDAGALEVDLMLGGTVGLTPFCFVSLRKNSPALRAYPTPEAPSEPPPRPAARRSQKSDLKFGAGKNLGSGRGGFCDGQEKMRESVVWWAGGARAE